MNGAMKLKTWIEYQEAILVILWLSFYVFYLGSCITSCILRLVSYVLYLTSCILRLVSYVLHLVFCVMNISICTSYQQMIGNVAYWKIVVKFCYAKYWSCLVWWSFPARFWMCGRTVVSSRSPPRPGYTLKSSTLPVNGRQFGADYLVINIIQLIIGTFSFFRGHLHLNTRYSYPLHCFARL